MADLESIRNTLERCGQSHLLRFYDELDEQQQSGLLEQIAGIDFGHLQQLIEQYVLNKPEVPLPENIAPAPILPARPSDEKLIAEYDQARRDGEQLIAQGKVGAFVVAGGQGTRLGHEGPKGTLEVSPVTRKPLFQIFAEQILSASRRTGATIPWYVMTSPDNDVPTRAFFRQHKYFSLNEDDVFFLVQGTMPAFDLKGKILLSSKHRLALSPDGHGGSLMGLRMSGALDDMARRSVELISYFQVDNPMVRCIDPLFLGLHHLHAAEMSAKALFKRNPMERVGNFCLADGKLTVIEYSDFPDQLARATTEDGHLRFSAGSIAIHILSRCFVERLTADGKCKLPFHRAEKKVPCVDSDGNRITPDAPNAVKLEMFIFDALPLAEQTVVLETLRDEEFSPIKNSSGEDSLATSLHDQVRRSAAWLESAGLTIPRDADGQVAAGIEISPLLADSPDALVGKVDPSIEIAPGQNLYLGE